MNKKQGFIKTAMAMLLCGVLAFSLTACGSIKKVLTSQEWKNVNDGDVYSFTNDGKGKHGDTEISYTLKGETVSITEGVSSVTPKEFTISEEGDITRMTSADGKTYYVPASDYDVVGEQVKAENINILTSTEFWKSANATAYVQFFKAGGGWVIMTGNTLSMSWEMVDNNTVKSKFDNNGTTYTQTLDIVNDGGNLKLVDNTGKTMYTPKQ